VTINSIKESVDTTLTSVGGNYYNYSQGIMECLDC